MAWTLHTAKQQFAPLRDDWDQLNEKLYDQHPFFDSRFVEPLVTHAADDNVHIAIHESEGTVDGMLLLSPGTGGRWETFLPAQAEITPLLCEPEKLTKLFKRLPRFATRLDLSGQDPLYTQPVHDTSHPSKAQPAHTTLNIDLSGDFETYWATRSKNLRRSLKRSLKKLDQDGLQPRLVIADTPAAILAAFERYCHLESRGWKGREGTALFPQGRQALLYRDVLERFAWDGHARIFELYVNDQLAASQMAIDNESMLVTIKTTHDESLRKYGVGRVLDYFMLQHLFAEQRFQVVEYYTNADQDQLSWASSARPIYTVSLYRNNILQRLEAGYRQLRDGFDPLAATAEEVGLADANHPASVDTPNPPNERLPSGPSV